MCLDFYEYQHWENRLKNQWLINREDAGGAQSNVAEEGTWSDYDATHKSVWQMILWESQILLNNPSW